jgi:hypothetical protein
LALARLVAGWPPEVREIELVPRREQLVARAASAPLWLEEAVLEAGLGLDEAVQALEKARHDAPEDPLPLAEALSRGDLRDPERSLVAQQLEAMLAAVPKSEVCARRWLRRLVVPDESDRDQCPQIPAVVTSAEARRLAAIAALAPSTRSSAALLAQLGRLAERDGAPEVRDAAKRALAGIDTLTTPACSAAPALVGSKSP